MVRTTSSANDQLNRIKELRKQRLKAEAEKRSLRVAEDESTETGVAMSKKEISSELGSSVLTTRKANTSFKIQEQEAKQQQIKKKKYMFQRSGTNSQTSKQLKLAKQKNEANKKELSEQKKAKQIEAIIRLQEEQELEDLTITAELARREQVRLEKEKEAQKAAKAKALQEKARFHEEEKMTIAKVREENHRLRKEEEARVKRDHAAKIEAIQERVRLEEEAVEQEKKEKIRLRGIQEMQRVRESREKLQSKEVKTKRRTQNIEAKTSTETRMYSGTPKGEIEPKEEKFIEKAGTLPAAIPNRATADEGEAPEDLSLPSFSKFQSKKGSWLSRLHREGMFYCDFLCADVTYEDEDSTDVYQSVAVDSNYNVAAVNSPKLTRTYVSGGVLKKLLRFRRKKAPPTFLGSKVESDDSVGSEVSKNSEVSGHSDEDDVSAIYEKALNARPDPKIVVREGRVLCEV
jgi:hypothetical protein